MIRDEDADRYAQAFCVIVHLHDRHPQWLFGCSVIDAQAFWGWGKLDNVGVCEAKHLGYLAVIGSRYSMQSFVVYDGSI